MGKLLLPLIFVISTLPAFAVCPNKINPAKVMLFVDANNGDLEIAAAQKAACKRGERLEVVPKTWKQYSTYQSAVEAAMTALRACSTKYPKANDDYKNSECSAQFQVYLDADVKMRDFASKQKSVSDQLKERMEELSKEKVKVKITNVTLSGHDGGGHFGGQKGSIGRGEVSSIMGLHPEMNDVQSLLLLGCYTGVQNEVAIWKGIFPKVKIIGGYDGSAPASNRVQGHDYITNILNKEKALLALKNKTNVDQDVKRMIGNLGELNSAVYIDLACKEEDDEFYYASKIDRKFNKLNLSDCQKAQVEIEKLRPLYNKLYSGEMEPPTETASGEVRSLYDKVRTYEHCMTNNSGFGGFSNEMNSNGAFNLLFWHGVKKNFGNFYDKDMKEVEAILKDLNADEMMKEISSQIEGMEKQKQHTLDQIAEYEKDPAGYKAKVEAEIQALKAKAAEAAKDPAYTSALQRMNSRNYVPTPEESAVISRVSNLNSEAYYKGNDVYIMKLSPTQYIQIKKGQLQNFDSAISYQKTQMSSVLTYAEKFKKIWIPTKENMEKKTRKEVMENLHAINGLMSTGALPKKKYAALSFVNSTTSNHLQYLRNPFSWHEFTSNTEAPPFAPKLANFLNSSTVVTMNNPYDNGMGGGGYITGGYVGGMGGGYGGGTAAGMNGGGQQVQEADRPVH